MSLKSEREKAATRLANGEDACSHPGNIAAVDCSECGPALFARELRAAEKRAMERLVAYLDGAVEYDPMEEEWFTEGDEIDTRLVTGLPLSIDQLLDE